MTALVKSIKQKERTLRENAFYWYILERGGVTNSFTKLVVN